MLDYVGLKTSEEEEQEKIYECWVSSLPDKIDNETCIDKKTEVITDNYGNVLCSLPKEPTDIIAFWNKQNLDIE